MPIGLDSRKAVSVARQPILDHAGHIFGYELPYRADADGPACRSNDRAGAQGDSDEAARLAARLGLTEQILPAVYSDAFRWARERSTQSAAA